MEGCKRCAAEGGKCAGACEERRDAREERSEAREKRFAAVAVGAGACFEGVKRPGKGLRPACEGLKTK